MNKRKSLFLLPLMLLASCSPKEGKSDLVSSVTTPNAAEFFTFEDSKLEENKVDDNYRNYYQIFVYSYADGNGDKVGDLLGIDQKLNYLHDLGYTGIWLTPIFKGTSYHKYDTIDYFQIDPLFGTLDDLKKLVKDAHALGMKVILDGVFNHVGVESSYFKDACEEHQKKLAGVEYDKGKEQLIRFFDTLEEAQASGQKYHKPSGYNFYYEGNFNSSMPEFDFDHEETYTFIQSVIDYYMADDIKVDGFRLDAVKYYFNGNNEKNVKALSKIEGMIKKNDPNGYAVGECWIDSASILGEYYKSDLDSYFWFPAGTMNGFIVSTGVEGKFKSTYYDGQVEMIEKANGHIPAPFLDNHDMYRISNANNKMKTKFNLGLRDTLTGAVFNYYGDEIGMNSTNLPSGSDYQDSSYRSHYFWDDDTHENETYDPPRGYAQTNVFGSAKAQLKDASSILNYEKKVLSWRNSFPAIARGEVVTPDEADYSINDTSKNPLLVVKKTYQDSTIKIVYNFSAMNTLDYDMKGYTPVSVLLADESKKASYSSNQLQLPPNGIALLKQ